MLERAPSPGLVHLEPGVLGLPPIERLLADGVLPAEIDALRPRIRSFRISMICSSVNRFRLIEGLPAGILADETLNLRGPVFGEQVERQNKQPDRRHADPTHSIASGPTILKSAGIEKSRR